jgi:hypothetical protein
LLASLPKNSVKKSRKKQKKKEKEEAKKVIPQGSV